MFAVCSALAFGHTWDAFTERPDPDRQASLRGLLAIGFIGSLLAYSFRSFTEAPGEKLRRDEYEDGAQAVRAPHQQPHRQPVEKAAPLLTTQGWHG